MKEGMAGLGLSPEDTATVFHTLAERHDEINRLIVALAKAQEERDKARKALREIRRLAKADPFWMSAWDRLQRVVRICGSALT